jgi:hypothetical protein
MKKSKIKELKEEIEGLNFLMDEFRHDVLAEHDRANQIEKKLLKFKEKEGIYWREVMNKKVRPLRKELFRN